MNRVTFLVFTFFHRPADPTKDLNPDYIGEVYDNYV